MMADEELHVPLCESGVVPEKKVLHRPIWVPADDDLFLRHFENVIICDVCGQQRGYPAPHLEEVE
jgi:hypothetical protein